MLFADGFEAAVLGVGRRCSQPEVVVYSYEMCVEILETQGMSHAEAVEYLEFNTVGAWVGDRTPMFVHEMDHAHAQEYEDI